MLSLGAFSAANLVAAIAPGFWSLAAARVLLALAAGLYVPNANALASALAAPNIGGERLRSSIAASPLRSPLACRWVHSLAHIWAGARPLWGSPSCPPRHWPRWRFSCRVTLRRRAGGIAETARGYWCPSCVPDTADNDFLGHRRLSVYTYISPYLSASAGLTPSRLVSSSWSTEWPRLVGVMLGGAGVDRLGSRAVQAFSLPAMAVAFAGLTVIGLLPIRMQSSLSFL